MRPRCHFLLVTKKHNELPKLSKSARRASYAGALGTDTAARVKSAMHFTKHENRFCVLGTDATACSWSNAVFRQWLFNVE